jgi:hypothetical protein
MMAQVLAVLSAVCFIAGGMLVGIGVTSAVIKRAKEDVAQVGAMAALRQDTAA